MQEIYRWEKEQKLDPVQSLWTQKSKPIEELYDITKDPHEINNLASDPQYTNVLKRLRKVHEQWTLETNDLGHRQELELLAEMWPDNAIPVTADPEITEENGILKIVCKTPGASLAYRYPNSKNHTWHVYNDTVRIAGKQHIEVLAMRIGYTKSQIISHLPNLSSQ